MSATGTAVLDFGSAPGTNVVSVTATGVAWRTPGWWQNLPAAHDWSGVENAGSAWATPDAVSVTWAESSNAGASWADQAAASGGWN